MTTQTVDIFRALPGAGKSFLAIRQAQANDAIIVSADHFFETEDGEYNFNPALLGQAHVQCMARFIDALTQGRNVVLDNTNTQLWEFENYVRIAKMAGAEVRVHEIKTPGIEAVKVFAERNTHGVPASVILAMWLRWEAIDDEAMLSMGIAREDKYDPYLGPVEQPEPEAEEPRVDPLEGGG